MGLSEAAEQQSATESFFELLVGRQLDLIRAEAAVVREQLMLLEEINARAVNAIRVRFDKIRTRGARVFRQQQWRDLEARVQQIYTSGIMGDQGASGMLQHLADALEELSEDEESWIVPLLVTLTGATITGLPVTNRAIATRLPHAGARLREWMRGLADQIVRGVTRWLRESIMAGRTTGETIDGLTGAGLPRGARGGILQTGRNSSATTTRTTWTSASDATRSGVLGANQELLAGLQWTATLDHATCVVCATLDGEVFPPGSGDRPPAHPNCRCWMTAVFEGDEPVSDRRFVSWLRRQPRATQDKVLGRRRGQLFRAGRLGTSDDPLRRQVVLRASNRPKSLRELERDLDD